MTNSTGQPTQISVAGKCRAVCASSESNLSVAEGLKQLLAFCRALGHSLCLAAEGTAAATRWTQLSGETSEKGRLCRLYGARRPGISGLAGDTQ